MPKTTVEPNVGNRAQRYVGCYLDQEMKAALEQEAAAEGVTASELFRRILDAHIDPPHAATPRQAERKIKSIGKSLGDVLDEIVTLKARKRELDRPLEQ